MTLHDILHTRRRRQMQLIAEGAAYYGGGAFDMLLFRDMSKEDMWEIRLYGNTKFRSEGSSEKIINWCSEMNIVITDLIN